MILSRFAAIGMGLAIGAVAGVVLYSSAGAAPTPVVQGRQVGRIASDPGPTPPAPTVTYAACVPPAVLQQETCVTHIVVTTVVPGPVGQARGLAAARVGEGDQVGKGGHREDQEHERGEDD